MGVLVNGKWQRDDSGFALDPSKKAGTFSTPVEEIPLERGHRYVPSDLGYRPVDLLPQRPAALLLAPGAARDRGAVGVQRIDDEEPSAAPEPQDGHCWAIGGSESRVRMSQFHSGVGFKVGVTLHFTAASMPVTEVWERCEAENASLQKTST